MTETRVKYLKNVIVETMWRGYYIIENCGRDLCIKNKSIHQMVLE